MEESHRYHVVCSGRSIIIVCRDCKEQWHLKFRWLLLLNFIGFLLPLAAVILYFQTDPPHKLIIPCILGVVFFFIGQLVPPPIFSHFLRKSKNIEKYLNQTN